MVIDLNKKAKKLMENQDFQDVILEAFIKKGILNLSIDNNIRSEAIQDQLIARRILHEWFIELITEEDTV